MNIVLRRLNSFLVLQFLKLAEFDNVAFQVVIGSGMGILSSDEISNYCFFKLVEEFILTDSHKQNVGLKLWLRFKDDIFVSFEPSHAASAVFCRDV